jgi:hypothetical protein
MRKKENRITDFRDIEKIMESSPICRLGLSNNNIPYKKQAGNIVKSPQRKSVFSKLL